MFHNTMSRRRLIALAGAGALGATVGTNVRMPHAHAALADQYELIDLGVTDDIGDTTLGFNDMNGAGVIVGNIDVDGTKNSPFVFQDETMTRIKTGEYGARISCINSSGVMGGRDLRGWHTEEQPWGVPALWIDGKKEVLPYPDGLPSPGEEGRVFDINTEGVAVGDVSISGGVTVPVQWRNGTAEILDGYVEGGRGTARLINDFGMIVGDLSIDGTGGGVIWTEFGVETYSSGHIDGATQFIFSGLDNFGRILGSLEFGELMEAALSTGNGAVPTLLPHGVDGAMYSGINCSLGDSLFGGFSSTADKAYAVIWDNGVAIELKTLVMNTKGLRLESVGRFSDDGWIAGNAVDGDGARHPYLLVPA